MQKNASPSSVFNEFTLVLDAFELRLSLASPTSAAVPRLDEMRSFARSARALREGEVSDESLRAMIGVMNVAVETLDASQKETEPRLNVPQRIVKGLHFFLVVQVCAFCVLIAYSLAYCDDAPQRVALIGGGALLFIVEYMAFIAFGVLTVLERRLSFGGR